MTEQEAIMREAIKNSKGLWAGEWYMKGELSATEFAYSHQGHRIDVTFGFTEQETSKVTKYDFGSLPYDDAHVIAFRFTDKKGKTIYSEELR